MLGDVMAFVAVFTSTRLFYIAVKRIKYEVNESKGKYFFYTRHEAI
jgi:hypothetical protein